MKIKYLASYDTEENKEQKRAVTPAAVPVVQSILKSLKEVGAEVEVVSFCSTQKESGVPAVRYKTEENCVIQLFQSFGRKTIVSRALNRIAMKLQYFIYLLISVKQSDVLIVYHSTFYVNMLCFIKKIKKCRLVLQMLEVYADVLESTELWKKEMKLTEYADAYIFPTELMNEKINTQNKPYVVMHGAYSLEADRKCNIFAGELHEKIHCVYAGTFDPRKGGAIAAAVAAEYLPENYHIHILGFGSETDKKKMQELIGELSQKCACTITYDGLLSGEKYIRFIQSCDIGLSTQNPDAAFNATSFPSKILSYMANGLRVVSIRIPAIEGSAIGEYMYYYDQQTPEAIAKAILKVDMTDDYDGRKIIEQLDREFTYNLKTIL